MFRSGSDLLSHLVLSQMPHHSTGAHEDWRSWALGEAWKNIAVTVPCGTEQ